MSKKILGLDLGTNSIGWALVDKDEKKIIGMGSRIIPMDEAKKNDFGKGTSISQTAERTRFRGIRRLRERHLLRRERLHRVLKVLGFLPEHYTNDIDFTNRLGQYLENTEPKIAWKKNGKKKNGKAKFEFLFQDVFKEMIEEFKNSQPQLFYNKLKIENGIEQKNETKIPYDWTIYYLRKKALEKSITKEQLAWLILNFNQKRGYYQLRGDEEEENPNKLIELHALKIVEVKESKKYALTLENGEVYTRTCEISLFEWKNTFHDFVVTTYLEKDGTIKFDKDGKEKRSYILKEDLTVFKSKKKRTSKINNVKVEEQAIKIVDVKEVNQEKIWYSLILENGWIYRRESKVPLFDWKDKVREFIVTTDINNDGSIKTDEEGNEKRSFRAPKEDDWTLVKKKMESDLENYLSENKKRKAEFKGTVGTYIYDTLLKNPKQKIRGKLISTIERMYYKDELRQILEKQIELQPELFTDDLYNECIRELYRSNKAHQQSMSKRDFLNLFLDDIIFYQRPLKSQKSSIGNCPLEYRLHKINKIDEDGNSIKNAFKKDENAKDIEIKEYLKAIPKSNPIYQEFRVWQWLYNLKIYSKAENRDVTEQFILGVEDIENLFEFLMSKNEVNHKDILEYFLEPKLKAKFSDAKPKYLKGKILEEIGKYRWNYVFDDSKDKEDEKSKKYPMNETGYEICRRLENVDNVPDGFLKKIDTKEIITKKGERQIKSLGTKEYQLWHIIYSVTDKKDFDKALRRFAIKNDLDEISFIENFSKIKPYPSEYGRYSEKAIKRMLPLMRKGKFWNWSDIDNKTKQRIDKIMSGVYDENIKDQVREKAILLTKNEDFQGLQLWLAQYIVYDRHSEAAITGKWKSISELDAYLEIFKQHSLRNPIVEQIVTETIRVVKDIWLHYGKGIESFIDEIHIELGREMKNPADVREQMTRKITENENTNYRIKTMLLEFSNDDSFKNQRDYQQKDGEIPSFFKKGNNPIRPFSPMQQEILKIYEDGVLNSGIEIPNEVSEILKKFKEGDAKKHPSKAEINRYKLWLEQKYLSPYTGQIIPLSKLFTPVYEIEHVIPQSRYFDDSLSNKVICESEVNKLKGNQLGLEFIKKHHGEKIEIENGTKTVEIFTENAYKNFVNEHYNKNIGKKNKLLLEEIPDKMIERQLNDTRYISKFISHILSNIVRIDEAKAKEIIDNAEIIARKETDWKKSEEIREKARSEANDDGVNSKNIILGNGKITSILKQDWGLNDVWNELILPRFERMNALNQTTVFTSRNKEGNIIPTIPLKFSKGFQKKRIDHRHHALDALVIACMTRDHVQYLNNENARNQKFHLQKGLAKKLRKFETVQKPIFEKDENNIWRVKKDKNGNQFTQEIEVPKTYYMPWENFTNDAKNELEKIVVSFKQNLRVINKATNHYEKIHNGKKVKVEQKGVNWAIRQPLHEETVSGKVELPWVKLGKDEILTATRERNDLVSIFKDVTTKEKAVSKIKKITDTGIQKILLNYLSEKENNPELAFSPEGVEHLNKNISKYNGGKFHQPIFKVRTYEKGKGRFALGLLGNKKSKYVQGAPNLFFAIYIQQECKVTDKNISNRCFETISLNIIIERLKNGLKPVPEYNELGEELLFHLSPDDLVYVPTNEERENSSQIDFNRLTSEQKKRLFFVNDFSGTTCYFRPNRIAKSIVAKEVDMNYDENKAKITGSFDTKTASFEGIQIKDVCIKLKVDRLGNISLPDKSFSGKVNEPEALYKKGNLKTFASHEEAAEYDAKEKANIPPEQHLMNVTDRIKKIYKDELKKPMDKNLKFRDNDQSTS